MTIAISLKVNDGLVLAADSATTITHNGSGNVINVYDNANKVFNLHKELPVGAITWGAGSIGQASIATLVKDFRKKITDDDEHKINKDSYTIEEITQKFYTYLYEENYSPQFKDWPKKPNIGFIIGGYSSNAQYAEEWRIDINNGDTKGPILFRKEQETGANWNGQPEAITRIFKGYSLGLREVLRKANIEEPKIVQIMDMANNFLEAPLIIPAMPIQDVIDIAHFLIDLTVKYVKYTPGAPTVGGPIEIAAITKHEGFKWVKRKHYFDKELNPKE